MLRSLILSLLIVVSLTLSSCSTGSTGLKSYINSTQGYKFLYPNGWIPVDVKSASEGVDVVFRDLVERTENLSVIISGVPENKTLADLGTPSEIGYRFLKQTNAAPNANREVELINVESHEIAGKTYYTLEYQVKLPNNQERHDIASVVVSRGKLFTFNLSTPQKRWEKVKTRFKSVVDSFSVY